MTSIYILSLEKLLSVDATVIGIDSEILYAIIVYGKLSKGIRKFIISRASILSFGKSSLRNLIQ